MARGLPAYVHRWVARLAPRQQQGTETGARWFTEPAHSVDDLFGLKK
jgi:hypothetical protein